MHRIRAAGQTSARSARVSRKAEGIRVTLRAVAPFPVVRLISTNSPRTHFSMKLDFSKLYTGDDDPRSPLARAFAWLTRAGIGRAFGSLPIGWYQMHQCAGLDVLKERAQAKFGADKTAFEFVAREKWGIECRPQSGGKWERLGWAPEMFAETDRRARK